MSEYYAHSLPDRPPKEWEPLDEHLRLVADGDAGGQFGGAAEFASAFGAREWGRLLGLWHDLGKYSEAFQAYIRAANTCPDDDGHAAELTGRVDHSTAGAQHAIRLGQLGRLLAYCIAGHHAGLPNNEGGDAGLSMRLEKCVEPYDSAPQNLLAEPLPPPPRLQPRGNRRRAAFAIGYYTRMLFSCLVDADFLATESFMTPDRSALRARPCIAMSQLLARLDAHLEAKQNDAPDTPVNRQRRQVLAACRSKAALPPGLFSLNVPTGGGKTLSSLAFALTHAVKHGLRHIVYAIPYTSIIEQTADVFRDAMADLSSAVLEHHSNIEPEDPKRQSARTRLAAENFDAPLIVTTNVQLFESLFASRTSRCRKLHRLARSVIILDEAQALPPNLLAPTLAAIDELVRNYGTTVVLCTATQPAVEKRDHFAIGLENVTPIIDDSSILHTALKRTNVEVVDTLTNEELIKRLSRETQVLCVVNSRRHAADVYKLLNDGQALHLSATMCARHRSAVLRLIRWRLRRGLACRVISTQVIEAGVDVDFPAVYRAAAGLDSIAQAAGRCNREGRLSGDEGKPRVGRVVVFNYDTQSYRTATMIERGAAKFREVMPDHRADLLAPEAVEAYFRLHYWAQGGDEGRGWDQGRGQLSVMDCFGGADGNPLHHQFRTAADRYQLIDDAQTPILVPYSRRGRDLIRALERLPDVVEPKRLRGFDRAAQRYVVGVRAYALDNLLDNGVVLERHGRHYVANNNAYSQELGLTLHAAQFAEALIV